jgi:hypothetical protein
VPKLMAKNDAVLMRHRHALDLPGTSSSRNIRA